MNPTVYIMRGISGAGKSTRAAEIRKQFDDGSPYGPPTAVIVSADDFFIGPDGVYRFDPAKLEAAHKDCQEEFAHQLNFGTPVVIVDNTNLQAWEYEGYVKTALQFGYEVIFEEFAPPADLEAYVWACAQRNSHGVPPQAVRAQARRWEPRK